MKHHCNATLLVATLLPAMAGAAAEPFETYAATARDLTSRALLYREEHYVRLEEGQAAERVVLYTCGDGRPFARKRLVYRPDPLAPDFLMENALSGHREGLQWSGRGATISYRENGASRERSGPLPEQPGLVADAGFDEFVRRNWDPLSGGQKLRFDFLVPSRLDYYSFKVRKLRSETLAGTPVQVFRLTLSGLWGWILPGIDVWYRDSDRTLVRYEGLSNLQNAAGENFKTLIEFPSDGRRSLASDAPMRAALQRPLVSSCS
jgi:hypothetical protein